MRTLLWISVLVMALGFGCGKSDKGKKLAGLCVEAGKMLEEEGSTADNDTFIKMIENALQACSGACDEKDEASCKALDEHLTKVCGVSPTMCDSFCTDVKSPSLKKYSCAHGTPK